MVKEALADGFTAEAPEFLEENTKKKLPQDGKRNILITSALPYVNNVPHLGNIIGCVLSADVFSRYCRIRGYQSLYVCGTDEYGTATEMKALTEGVTPAEICEKYFKLHKQIYEWFNIDFDHFGRTTTNNQTEITQDMFLKLHKNGFTSTHTLQQLHCDKCNKFLADRYVHGTCPHCQFDDARGDQCDKCGKLLDAVDLVNPKCHICGSKPEAKMSEHIFLDLDKLAPEVEKLVEGRFTDPNGHWSPNAIAIVRSWLKGGLEKRCITRDLKWGTPVPLANFSSKVFYVWFDAPIGYLSITKTLLGDDWTKWWKNPDNVELYNFLGKDNVAFHGVIFPATQLGTGDDFTIVRHMCATEYLNYEDQKFSKSRGTGVFGDAVADIGIPADVWRFYLIYMRPESQDTAFCWDDFMLKVNSELLANLGNFVLRALSFLANNFGGVVPEIELSPADKELIVAVNKELEEFTESLEHVKLRDALLKILAVSRHGNQYMQANQPWVLVKGSEADKKRAGTVIGLAANLSVLLSTMLYPFMPAVSQQIREQCRIEKPLMLPKRFAQFLKTGHTIGSPTPLFTKLEPAKIAEWKARFGAVNGEATPAATVKQQAKKPPGKDAKKMTDKKKTPNDESEFAKNDKNLRNLLGAVTAKFEASKITFQAASIKKIEDENGRLRKDVDSLKEYLCELERKNGVTLYETNIPKGSKDANASTATPSAPLQAEASEKKDAPAAPKEKGNKKEKAAAQPAKKGGAANGTFGLGTLRLSASIDGATDSEIDVGRLDLRVGRIVEAKKHPDADALYVETIDLGEEKPRTVVSGLVRHVPLEQMQNRLVVCLCNLKPAKMRGIESQAMVMCASTPDKVEIMDVDPSCKPGQRVACPAFASRPDAPFMNPKKKIWETVAPDLAVSADGKATYKGEVLLVDGNTPMTAATLRNCPVK